VRIRIFEVTKFEKSSITFQVLKVSGRFSCPNNFNQEGETYGFQEIVYE